MYFIMANYFYIIDNVVHVPAEISVGKFTLQNGLERGYHSCVNPEQIKLGYLEETRNHSDQVHHMPIPPEAMGEKNYNVIYKQILEMLDIKGDEKYEKGDMRRPCVYVVKKGIRMMESILDELSSDDQWNNFFDVFELELLFNELMNSGEDSNKKLPITITSAFIEQDRFEHTPGLACDFHEKDDTSKNCSLSYVKRWFYIFGNHVAQKFGIDPVSGIHIPADL